MDIRMGTEEKGLEIGTGQILERRLRAHHLDRKLPESGAAEAAGVCGLQNSPPGAWETAMFRRVRGCTQASLACLLYEEKSLLQAWSFRGAPVVFPTDQSDIFLTALEAGEGEEPWIYTRGITAALEFLRLPFDELLCRTKEAAGYLDGHTVRSKEELDRTLAGLIGRSLPAEKRALWEAPSMYGRPDRQTAGEAAVSFLLRPCSFSSLVVFGKRQNGSPAFTSFRSWTGHSPKLRPECGRLLARKYLHAFGPASLSSFKDWLGCSGQQALRLWNSVAQELEPGTWNGKKRYLLAADMPELKQAAGAGSPDRLLLLGAHDPYLDGGDRAVLLEEQSLHKAVWKTAANPGVILKGGRIAGIWISKKQADKLELSLLPFAPLRPLEKRKLTDLAEEYAAFRELPLSSCRISL